MSLPGAPGSLALCVLSTGRHQAFPLAPSYTASAGLAFCCPVLEFTESGCGRFELVPGDLDGSARPRLQALGKQGVGVGPRELGLRRLTSAELHNSPDSLKKPQSQP